MKKSYPQGPRDWLCFFRNYPLGFNFFNFHARNRLPPGIGSCFSLYCSPWSSCYCIKAKYFSQIKSSERGHICPACRCGTVKWFSWNRPHREHFAQKPVLLEAGTCQSQNKAQPSGPACTFSAILASTLKPLPRGQSCWRLGLASHKTKPNLLVLPVLFLPS